MSTDDSNEKDSDEKEEKKVEKKARKQRSDKGLVMATERDLYCIEWVAEQYAARADQVRKLLSKFPDPKRPFQDGKMISETTLRDQLSRWVRAGWVGYRRVLADQPGYVWATRKGLALVGLDEIYTAREPASTRLVHIYAVNQLRLHLDSKYVWKSERRYRHERMSQEKTKKGDTLSIPDGIITSADKIIAIEAELTPKKPAEIEAKLARLVRRSVWRNSGLEPEFPTIWFYIPNERLKKLIEDGRESLREDEQKRVFVAISDKLLPSTFSR